jgi:hypothetical protein
MDADDTPVWLEFVFEPAAVPLLYALTPQDERSLLVPLASHGTSVPLTRRLSRALYFVFVGHRLSACNQSGSPW